MTIGFRKSYSVKMIVLALLAITAQSFAQAPLSAAQQVAVMVEQQKIQGIWASLIPQTQMALGSPQNLAMSLVGKIVGTEVCLDSEVMSPGLNGLSTYDRVASLSSAEMVSITLTLVPTGQVAALWVAPLQGRSTCVQSYRTKTALKLPFSGDWTVLWGGRTPFLNYHVNTVADAYFAYDICALNNGMPVVGSPSSNSSYPCYGRDILAPAAGTVVEVVDGIAENVPGYPNPNITEAAGNHVTIDHGNGEFSMLAHMQPHTITVHVGDHVTAGQTLGKCGNSGNSTQPHLHYQLSAGPQLFGGSLGLPAEFQSYVANGQPVLNGEPIKGQTIHQ